MVPLFQRISLSPLQKKETKPNGDIFLRLRGCHNVHSHSSDFKNNSAKTFFSLLDLRISGFGYHGTQLLYAVINVESSSPLNCRQAGTTGRNNTSKFIRSGISIAQEANNSNPSNKKDKGAICTAC